MAAPSEGGRRGGRRPGRGSPRTVAQSDVPHPEGVIFEFVIQGAFVRVAAVDQATGAEASIVADRTASQDEMERIALAKLDWVMRGRRAAGGPRKIGQGRDEEAPRKRGPYDYET